MTKSSRRILGAAGLLAASVLIARLLGYVRDALFAAKVGVGPAADAYFAAFMIPDILGYLMAAGAGAVAVTPPYIKRLENQGPEAAARFASTVVGNVGLISILLTAVLWVFAEPLLRLQFSEFDEETLQQTLYLMRIVLPAQIFFLTGGILRGVLMAHGKFAPQAIASVVYSATPILGGAIIYGAEGFAWGTLLGAFIGQWIVPVIALRRLPGAVGNIRIGIFDGDFKEYLWLALPLMLGLGLTTVDEWYEKWVGGHIATGAIAAITYARKLMMAPVGVVGQAVGAALLPTLTALYHKKDISGFENVFTTTLRSTLGLGILAAGALAGLAIPMVQFIYERGEFTSEYTQQVSGLLLLLAFAVPSWVVQQVAVRGFYARGEMWRAMILSTIIALAVFPIYLWGGRSQGIPGLAIASVFAISLNACITITWLRLRCGAPKMIPLINTLLRSSLIASISAIITYYSLPMILPEGYALIRLLVGSMIYLVPTLLLTFLIGDEPTREGLNRVLSKITRKTAKKQTT